MSHNTDTNTDTCSPYYIDGSEIHFTIPNDQKDYSTMEWYQKTAEPNQWYKIIIDLKEGKISIIPIKKE